MNRRRLFVLVPSPHPTGPIKGAVALANAAVADRPVTLVTMKPGPGIGTPVDHRVEQHSLQEVSGGWRGRVAAYRSLLDRAGGRGRAASVSMCLSADVVNSFCRGHAVTCASVRGNLPQNYRMDYGLAGIAIAMAHLAMLRRFDQVVALTQTMAAQVGFYARRRPVVIGNFVDEASLEPYRAAIPAPGPLRFVFVGSLTRRKHPLALLQALHEVRRSGVDATLDIVGSGTLAASAVRETKRLGVDDCVTFHGHLVDPYPVVARADAFVLPSLSEGLARSAVEALYLGVPCVLRDVDGNAELVRTPDAGAVFSRDDELPNIMVQVARQSRAIGARRSLLGAAFSQCDAVRRYLDLLDATS